MPTVNSVHTRWGDITPDDLAEIKIGYEAANAFRPPAESFTLGSGQVMLTAFAKHLIDYCEAQGLVATDLAVLHTEIAAEDATIPMQGGPIERGQKIVSDFFEGITGIVAYAPGHIAIFKGGEEPAAIIASHDLANALSRGVGN